MTLEKLAEIICTDTNYLGQCERGKRRFSLDKIADIIEYFGITPNDIIPYNAPQPNEVQKNVYMDKISVILNEYTDIQLAAILNILNDLIPYLKK